jgi:isoleucyl-tRNA synthetase
MRLVMRLASLGHAARAKANRKVRQPLAEAAFSVGNPDERRAVYDFDDLLTDELNVKKVRLLDASTEAVSHSVKPLPKQLGQKYGNKFPSIAKAIQAMDADDVATTFVSGKTLKVEVEGQNYNILADEVEVKTLAKEGFAVAEDGPYVAALVTDLTPELVHEGLAREFVRRVQDFRKTTGFDVSDRILLYLTATPELKAAIETHRETIMAETLCIELHFAQSLVTSKMQIEEFDGERVTIAMVKAVLR